MIFSIYIHYFHLFSRSTRRSSSSMYFFDHPWLYTTKSLPRFQSDNDKMLAVGDLFSTIRQRHFYSIKSDRIPRDWSETYPYLYAQTDLFRVSRLPPHIPAQLEKPMK